MKSDVCFVCLKTYSSFGGDEEETRRLYSTFWRFATEYLGISSTRNASEDKLLPLLCKTGTFCGDCENVVSSICQLYRELLQAKLRLSSRLGELFGLMEGSESRVSYKLRRLLSKSLAEQLGFQQTGDLDSIRSLLKNKCKLKRSKSLPQVIIERAIAPTAKLADVIKLEITTNHFLEALEYIEDVDNDLNELDTLCPDEIIEEQHDEIQKENSSPSRESDLIQLADAHGEVNQVGDGSEVDEHPQIKKELDSEEEEIEEDPIVQPDSDSSFEPEDHSSAASSCSVSDSDNDWETEQEKKRSKPGSTSTSKNKTRTNSQAHHQQDEEDFSCPTCFKRFITRKQQSDHIIRIHGERIPCLECDKSFKSRSGLRDHIEINHSLKTQTYNCLHCQKVFNLRTKLRSHLNYAHPNELRERKSKLNLFNKSTYSVSQDGDEFSCLICSRDFISRVGFEHHMVAFHKPESHPCSHCDKSFRTKSYLGAHIYNVHPEHSKWKKKSCKPKTQEELLEFPCPSCTLVLSNRAQLVQHLKGVHRGRRHVCSECSKSFKAKSSLKVHMIASHKPEVHPCPYQTCGKILTTKAALGCHISRVHKKRHSKDNKKRLLYKCPLCERNYTNLELLERHLLSCGQNEKDPSSNPAEQQQKLHKCPTLNCPMSYLRKFDLERHLETCEPVQEEPEPTPSTSIPAVKHEEKVDAHKKVEFSCSEICEHCGKLFKTKATLNNHMRNIHQIRKREAATCEQCGKSFVSRQEMLSHLRRIHDRRDSPCPFCGKVFSTPYRVTVHVRLAHKDERK